MQHLAQAAITKKTSKVKESRLKHEGDTQAHTASAVSGLQQKLERILVQAFWNRCMTQDNGFMDTVKATYHGQNQGTTWGCHAWSRLSFGGKRGSAQQRSLPLHTVTI
jgi:hypothetical protein